MKKFIVAIVFVLMTAGTASAHGVNFRIGVGIPFYPYTYPSYTYPAPHGYYYSAPYRYYYPPAVYRYSPVYGSVTIHKGYGHGYYGHGWDRHQYNHFRHGYGAYGHGRGFRR